MEQLGQKSNLKFFKVHVLNGFNRKTYKLGHPILFMDNLKIFQRLFAWLVCLDELEGFVSRFLLQKFVIWLYFWWVFFTKLGEHYFLCLPNSVQVFLKNYWTGMVLEPTHAEQIGKFFNPLTPRRDWKTRSQLSVKWIEPIKKSKVVSLQTE